MYGTFEHTADIGIYGSGKNFKESLEELAKALFSVMYSKKGKKKKFWEFEICEKDRDLLVLEYLNNLIAKSNEILFSDISVIVEKDCLKVKVWYSDFDSSTILTEVKGATLSGLKISDKRIEALVDV